MEGTRIMSPGSDYQRGLTIPFNNNLEFAAARGQNQASYFIAFLSIQVRRVIDLLKQCTTEKQALNRRSYFHDIFKIL